ncbi:orotidine-5'-phosphate decarboxylase [Allobranchiibius sp. GilTou73]|uniref:orotidine-5'-phosphate decarboxylase n=1 Tax=Allobranchiibius sp. GilTou73 TaxID=2904523 RepID=UPI001F3B98F5|nr:orotidine-5'-phosphate decarboxylase [Allobranchiibius sp. GilTou73]UIJ34147.1 orotidine-5'-phosphate decarboxylase [Allobranchiibius sp. GilTou73]
MTSETPGGSANAVGGRAPFGVRLRAAMDAHGPLCAGIDPHRALVEAWGLPYTLAGVERFAMTCAEAFGGQVAAVKPQSAFFEVFGSKGVALLERVVAALRDAGTLTVLDVKRGDIGSTMAAYADAFLRESPHAPDAITLSPFLGYESLRPAIDLAHATGRGVFVLALTSNPEGASVQHATLDGVSVARSVVSGAAVDNAPARGRGELGSVGLVVGATVGDAVRRLDLHLVGAATPVLAPGVGAQGAGSAQLLDVFGAALPQVLAASSREVLGAGPDVRTLRDTARRTADALRV